MKHKILIAVLLVAVVIVFGRSNQQKYQPYNSRNAQRDTLYIDSTEAKWTDIFWHDKGAEKMLVVQADDTSQNRIGNDSAAVKIELYQAYPAYDSMQHAILLQSRANPDSTSWPYSSDFVIDDSLDIAEMDTTALYCLTAEYDTNLTGDTTDIFYTTVIDSQVTDSLAYKAYEHYWLAPDASPGILFKVTGKSSNKITGAGTMWIFNIYQIDGTPTKPR